MPSEAVAARPVGTAVHATAVAIGARGLLILGPSGCGKSRLACELIAASLRDRPIRLVGDDRILLTGRDDDCWARAHPRIAGFIERRGFGIVAMPFATRVRLAGLVALSPCIKAPGPVAALPCWRPDEDRGGAEPISATEILAWWRDVSTTPETVLRSPVGRERLELVTNRACYIPLPERRNVSPES